MEIGGIDIGTTGCKLTIADETGKVLYCCSKAYPFSRSAGDHSFRAEVIFEAVRALLRQGAARVPQLAAVGVTSFGEAFALLDEQDQTAYPTVLNTDARGVEEMAAFTARCGRERICQITGAAPHSLFSVANLLWIKKHEPMVWSKVRTVLLMEDYVVYRLSGVRQIDYALASRTMLFDINTLSWSHELMQAAQLDAALFSKPVPAGTRAGPILPALAAELGCRTDLQIVTCCHDQIAAAVGSGVFEPGMAVDGAGTHECITPVFAMPDNREIMYRGNFAIVPFFDAYVTYAFLFTGGALVKWYIETLAGYAKHRADLEGKNIYAILEEEMTPEPTGMLVLPHFDGAATPYMDEGSKGAFVGMQIGCTQGALYQAVLEGITYEMRINMEQLELAGIHTAVLHATGGGAGSKRWLQMKADILGVPVVTFDNHEAGSIGSIILTGMAMGVFTDLPSACKRFIRQAATYLPNAQAHCAYTAHYKRYQKLYEAIRPII